MKLRGKRKEIKHYIGKLGSIDDLYECKELRIGYDILAKSKSADHELLYFLNGAKEIKGIFVFGYDFFLKELKDRELKKVLGYNFLNFVIHSAYMRLAKDKMGKVKVNDIVNYVQRGESSVSRHAVLKRILTLAYYHGWDLEKVDGIDSDYSVVIPQNFRKRLKQRFNVDVYMSLADEPDFWFFVNLKGDLVLVFKNKSEFSRKDVEKVVADCVCKEFGVEQVVFE
jgi:hypothetical protein